MLAEPALFFGRNDDLEAVRGNCFLPVLREHPLLVAVRGVDCEHVGTYRHDVGRLGATSPFAPIAAAPCSRPGQSGAGAR